MTAIESRTNAVTVVRKPVWRRILREQATVFAIYGLLVAMSLAAAIYSPVFRQPENITNVLRQAVLLGIVSIGQTIVILTAGIDLGVGSGMMLLAMLASGFIDGKDERVIPVVAACIVLGVLIGLYHGLLVTKLHIDSFIVTLGSFSILRGIGLGYSTAPIGSIPDSMSNVLYYGQLGPIPYVIIGFAVFVIIAVVILRMTPFGRMIFAVGNNPQVARRAGMNVDWVRIAAFAISGLCMAIAAMVAAGRAGVGGPQIGEGIELDSVTMAVIGGASFFGGRGSVIGTLGGVLILSLVFNLLVVLNISRFYHTLIKGIIIMLAITIYKQQQA